jgi:methionyl-tRNA formyltransferase
MKILVLTSARFGTASHHLSYLCGKKNCEIAMVILNEGSAVSKGKRFIRVIKKTWMIGLIGAINGVRMRKWYTKDVHESMSFGDIEEICKINKIPFFITPAINSEITRDLFVKAQADLGISLGNGYIGKRVFSIPKFGMINIHHEMLPEYQNAQSVIWQIYNKSPMTGYTIHKIDKHIDTGEILLKKEVPIMFKSTLRQTVSGTCASLLDASAKGLLQVLSDFEELFGKATPQAKGHTYTTPSFRQYLRIMRNFRELRDAMMK